MISSPNKRHAVDLNTEGAASGSNVHVTWWTNKTGVLMPLFRASNDGGSTFANCNAKQYWIIRDLSSSFFVWKIYYYLNRSSAFCALSQCRQFACQPRPSLGRDGMPDVLPHSTRILTDQLTDNDGIFKWKTLLVKIKCIR